MPDIVHQYRTIAAGAGWRRRAERGRLRFDGADRVTFLQALVTNDLASLKPGRGTYAAYLTPQGRMITDLHIFLRGDSLLADVPAALASGLAAAFDRLIFAEDVRVADVSSTTAQISVCGGTAANVLSRALGAEPDALRALPVWAQHDAGAGFVARTDDAPIESFDVFAPATDVAQITKALAEAGAQPLSDELAEALRIEAGRPAFGADMNEDTIPLEAGLLERAISTSKGCYVGQEIVIRVLHRGGGRVAKRLVRLSFDRESAAAPPVGAALTLDQREIGRITSVAQSPRDGRFIALGYVHRDAAEAGRTVDVGGGAETVTANIVGLAG